MGEPDKPGKIPQSCVIAGRKWSHENRVSLAANFWTFFDSPDDLVAALSHHMTPLMQSSGMNDKLVLRSRISMGNNDIESAEKFVTYLQTGGCDEAVFAILVEWLQKQKMGHLIKKDAPGERHVG